MLRDQLKIKLKEWEHNFIKQHGREPSKDDIKRLPKIRDMYRKYARLRKDPSSVVSPAPQKQLTATNVTTIELGPTPQIYGKAMSIFEMNVSPIKHTQTESIGGEEKLGTDETTSIGISEHATHQIPAVKRQLTFSCPTPTSSPKKELSSEHKAYGPNSPLKWGKNSLQISIKTLSPLKRTPVKGVNHEVMSFSPSPLVKRPLTRSLLELMKEHEAIVEEFKQIEGTESNETLLISKAPENIFEQEDEMELEDEGKPIKSRKRRILRRKAVEVEDGGVSKSIADEIKKLKRQRINDFMGFEDELAGENSEQKADQEREQIEQQGQETDKKITVKVGKKRNKKYNLVSNNFKRLKLPTRKTGNRRWNNRRR